MDDSLDEVEAHREALLRWLDELNERYGPPTAEEFRLADRVIDEAMTPHDAPFVNAQKPRGSRRRH